MTRNSLAGALLVGIALGLRSRVANAQSTTQAPDTTIREYRGAYQRGFEQSWFIPCQLPAGETRWWVTLTDEALTQRDSLLATLSARPTGGLEMRVRATVGPRTEAGMMGGGSRYMLITKILEIRALPSNGKCSPLSSA
ncbi:MAG: hypothetical protein V4550_00565 [Gemmatimonadota bacterium]